MTSHSVTYTIFREAVFFAIINVTSGGTFLINKFFPENQPMNLKSGDVLAMDWFNYKNNLKNLSIESKSSENVVLVCLLVVCRFF